MTAEPGAWLVDERWYKAYPLGPETTIGRGAHNTIILRDRTVSRVHAHVARQAGGFVLHALGASGTLVNGAPAAGSCELREGDVLEIASSTLRFTTRPPTEEMFIVPHDQAHSMDRLDGPTRATLRVARRLTSGVPRIGWLAAVALAGVVLGYCVERLRH